MIRKRMDKPQMKRYVRREDKGRPQGERPRTREELLVLLELERKKNERLRQELEILLAMDCS